MLDMIIVEEPARYRSAGSLLRSHADAAWQWMCRDLCPDLLPLSGDVSTAELELAMPHLLGRIREAMAAAAGSPEQDQRLRASLGTGEAREALPALILALRSRNLLVKARAFGNAINSIGDDAALGAALQAMPLQDPPLAALLFHAALGQVGNPTRVITTIIKVSGGASEGAVIRAGFGPVVDAILAHAQNQLHVLQASGPFADIDRVCRSLELFHRQLRSVVGYVELSRNGRWSAALTGIIKQASDRVEPRLRTVLADLNLAMRRGREGSDRLDGDAILGAINGMYLLATLRECRDSLALNTLFEQTWNQVGQALELHLQRQLDLIRQQPDDAVTGARLDAAIKMAEIRFKPEYGETLRRARAAAERQV